MELKASEQQRKPTEKTKYRMRINALWIAYQTEE